MTLDSSNSRPTANETTGFQHAENSFLSKGAHVPASEPASDAEIKLCAKVKCAADAAALAPGDEPCTTWSYLFVHNQKVRMIEARLKTDHQTFFVHRTIRYMARHNNKRGAREVMAPSVSGLIFLQGEPQRLQAYLDNTFPRHHLCKNCSTGRVAVIPNRQMVPFMRVAEANPARIRFLLRPFVYYAKNRTLLRIVSGPFAGLEGYVVRIARDRRLVMCVGGMSVAIAGVHAERFVEVGKNEASRQQRALFYKRQLHERNAFIDRYFHQAHTPQEVDAQAENINMLRRQTLDDVLTLQMDARDAFASFCFIIEEIGYYYAPFVDSLGHLMHPIFAAGKKVWQELPHLMARLLPDDEARQRYEADYEELRASYGYLFENTEYV